MTQRNLRNNAVINQGQGDFIRRQDHLYTHAMTESMFRWAFQLREFWMFSQIHRNSANVPVVTQNGGRLGDMVFTASAGAIATISPNGVLQRRGHGGEIRLGGANNGGGYVVDNYNARIIGSEAETIPADRGLLAFAGMRHPAGYAVPNAGYLNHAIVTKYGTGGQRCYMLNWTWQTVIVPNSACLSFVVSNNGTNIQAWYFLNLVPSAGAGIYMVGACFVPGVGCYGFVNDQWEFRGNADFTNTGSAVPMAAVFQGTDRLCIARRDDAAGAGTNQHPDAYWQFAGVGAGLVTPDTWLSMYRFTQPMLGWNTDLGGT